MFFFSNYFSILYSYTLYSRTASYLVCPYSFVGDFLAINCIKGGKGAGLGPSSSGPYRPLTNVRNDVRRYAGTDLSSCYGEISTGVLCRFLPMVG